MGAVAIKLSGAQLRPLRHLQKHVHSDGLNILPWQTLTVCAFKMRLQACHAMRKNISARTTVILSTHTLLLSPEAMIPSLSPDKPWMVLTGTEPRKGWPLFVGTMGSH